MICCPASARIAYHRGGNHSRAVSRSRTAEAHRARRAAAPWTPDRTCAASRPRRSVQGGVASQQRYAEELLRQGRAGEAIDVYRQALKGLYEHDPESAAGPGARAVCGRLAAGARGRWMTLIRHNPEFKSPDGHLLYARALEGEGADVRAGLDEYQELSRYYAGAEAPCATRSCCAAQGAGRGARDAGRPDGTCAAWRRTTISKPRPNG